MNYHVLARKWRPQTFADLVGQNHVVKALTFALSQNHVHHAYLFTGTRGVGKTSIARIFAKSLNCEKNGVSANPCGECESCLEIKSGKFVDLIEVDAASRTGVDETRELIDSVSYLPTKGRYKVYLIDEVHMFSKSSFNALLKTLEEPPAHVKFILATTDPDKLPITILSRCLQFNLKSLTTAQITQHLSNICRAESISYEKGALTLLAKAGDGSMRDTLSITDQAIAYGQGTLNIQAVTEILGTIQPTDIEAILFAIATNNPNQLNAALHRLDEYEVDARAFLIEIMRRLQRMAWAKEGVVEDISTTLLSVVNEVPTTLLHLWYDIAAKALPNLAIAGDPREAVEMTLLRMLAFIPSDWVPRHRTLLDDDKPSSIVPNVVNERTNNSNHETSSKKHRQDEFAEQLHATPVTASDNLEAAEQQFDDHHVESSADDRLSHDPNGADKNDNLATPLSEDKEAQQQSWHLSEESSDVVPSMENIRAFMQKGRDIKVPQKRSEKMSDKIATAPIADASDVPPWEENTEDSIAITESKGQMNLSTVHDDETTLVTSECLPNQAKVDVKADKPSPQTNDSKPRLSDFDWHNVVYQLGLTGYTLNFVSLGLLRVKSATEPVNVVLDLSPKHEVMINEDSLGELQQALQHYWQKPVTKIAVNLTEIDVPTPDERREIIEKDKQNQLIKEFSDDPIVQQAVTQLGGEIIEKTVKHSN